MLFFFRKNSNDIDILPNNFDKLHNKFIKYFIVKLTLNLFFIFYNLLVSYEICLIYI